MSGVTSIDAGAEGSVISAALASDSFRAELLSEPEDYFTNRRFLVLRQAIERLDRRGDVVDPLSLAREAEELGLKDAEKVVWSLPQANPKYLTLLARSRLKRKVAEIGKRLLSSTDDPEKALAESVESALAALSRTTVTPITAGQAGQEAIETLGSGPPNLVKTGIPQLDTVLRFLGPGDVLTIGARPGAGKSALATQIAATMATAGSGVAFNTLEMSSRAVAYRLISQLAQIDHERLQDGKPTAQERAQIPGALEALGNMPLFIIDRPGLTPADVRAAAIRTRQNVPIEAIIVDYLQLLRLPPHLQESDDYHRLTYLSGEMTKIAKDLGVLVISLSQLRRPPDGLADRRPGIADLKGSGAIEQDSTAIVLLHRKGNQTETEMIVDKNRPGKTGVLKALWSGRTVTFKPIS